MRAASDGEMLEFTEHEEAPYFGSIYTHVCLLCVGMQCQRGNKNEVSFPASLSASPITGRVFLFVVKDGGSEPRSQSPVILLAAGIKAKLPGQPVTIDGTTQGFPLNGLADVPSGDYYIQAVLNVFTEFKRADGHVIWAHMDQWEGQDFSRSPGNLVSESQRVHLDHSAGYSIKLTLDKKIPPIEAPADTEQVKRIKIQSKLLTQFWGHPMFIGATILLPKGYESHSEVSYPVIYLQGHFSYDAPLGFTTEPDKPGSKSWARLREEWAAQHLKNMPEPPPGTHYNGALMNVESGYEFGQAWNSDNFPRLIAVSFQHPTPYFDDSYGVNSPNAGPYGDAIMNELIPAVEERFRVIRKSYARVLTGGSTGGWGAFALQVFHPEFFGGTWSFYPDPVDYHCYYGGIDLYSDENGFVKKSGRDFVGGGESNRGTSRYLSVLGTQDAGFEWDKLTPVGPDGYPAPAWDLKTGKIDHQVVEYMKEHNDLAEYLRNNWSKIGPQLEGKLHFFIGDEDDGYSNLAVYLLENYLEGTSNPYYGGSFEYGHPLKHHGWQPTTNAELVQTMSKYIAAHAPAGEGSTAWQYK